MRVSQYSRVIGLSSLLLLGDKNIADIVRVFKRAEQKPSQSIWALVHRAIHKALEYGLIRKADSGYSLTHFGLYAVLPVMIRTYQYTFKHDVAEEAYGIAVLSFIARSDPDFADLDKLFALAANWCSASTCRPIYAGDMIAVNRSTGEYRIIEYRFLQRLLETVNSDPAYPRTLPRLKKFFIRTCELLDAVICDDKNYVYVSLKYVEDNFIDEKYLGLLDNSLYDMIGTDEILTPIIRDHWGEMTPRKIFYIYIIDKLWEEIFEKEIVFDINLLHAYEVIKDKAGSMTKEIVKKLVVDKALEKLAEINEILEKAQVLGFKTEKPTS